MKLRRRDHVDPARAIEKFDVETDLAEVGAVLTVGDGIGARPWPRELPRLEMLSSKHGVTGSPSLEKDNVGVALSVNGTGEGRRARPAHRKVAVGPGRRSLSVAFVDPLGNPLDGSAPSSRPRPAPVEWKAPGVIQRQPVKDRSRPASRRIDSMTNVGAASAS